MATKGGSKMFWIIGGLIVVAGSVGAYFLLRKPKDEKGSGETDADTDTDTKQGEGSGSDSGSVSTTKTYTAPSDLNDSTKIKAFQDWMDVQGKGWIQKNGKWVLLNKGAGYGNYGKSTDAVWKVYGKDYLKSLSNTTSTTPVSTTDLSKNIELIVKNATGTKSDKSTLLKSNTDFVNTWAKAFLDRNTAFIWANQVYRTKSGDKVLEYNPIGVKHYAKITGDIGKLSADDSSIATKVYKGTDLGKIEGVKYNKGALWLYAPNESSIYKWYKIDYVTRDNMSNFSGANNQIEFSSFDNNFDLNL
jgi:hypothetical protein